MSNPVLASEFGAPVQVIEGVTRTQFDAEIRPGNRPVLLKGLVSGWPACLAARGGMACAVRYLKERDNGVPADTLLGEPSIQGDFFYGETTRSLNFLQGRVPISVALDRLVEQAGLAEPHSVYVQSASLSEHMPLFARDNATDLIDGSIDPRIWIGNAVRVQTHYDLSDNVACLVAGRRRFTLFPPDQIRNLYPGPFESTLAGTPVSMVKLEAPDLVAYPRFAEAARHALVADLEPGDAVFIPYGWWHHVRSFERFNILVNYWWSDRPHGMSPYDALLASSLAFRGLEPRQKAFWRDMLDFHVFSDQDDSLAHLPVDERGALGGVGREQQLALVQLLLERLARQIRDNNAR